MERRAQRAAIVQGIAGLSSASGFCDNCTRQHSERVVELALQVGRELGFGSERLELLRLAALIHDLGEIGVPDDVPFKSNELTANDRAVIERPPSVAAEILSGTLAPRRSQRSSSLTTKRPTAPDIRLDCGPRTSRSRPRRFESLTSSAR